MESLLTSSNSSQVTEARDAPENGKEKNEPNQVCMDNSDHSYQHLDIQGDSQLTLSTIANTCMIHFNKRMYCSTFRFLMKRNI